MMRLLRIRRKSGKAKNSRGSDNIQQQQKLDRETMHFLNIFPELVWKCIAKHLDCNGFHNLINSSPFFRNLFKEARVQRLFESVFEIVVPQIWKYSFRHDKDIKALIFNCRLVCQMWNKSLCNLVENQFLQENFYTCDPQTNTTFKGLLERYQLKKLNQVDKFLKKFENFTSNQFFGKSLFLFVPPICDTDNTNSINQKFYESILFVLDLFGRYVYNCEIRLSSENRNYCIDSQRTYFNLVELLWAMPNLKTLRIFKFSKVLVFNIGSMRMPPTLGKLENLELHSVSRTVCEALVRRNLHVSSLFIHQSFNNDRKAGYLMWPFHNLEHIELKHYNWSEICCLKDSSVNWKLKSLKLDFYTDDDGKEFYRVNCSTVWSDIFNILSKCFGESLEDLRLELPEMTNDINRTMVAEHMLHYRLNFPKLKTIDLMVGNYSPVDFLLGVAKSLENLIITFSLSDHNTIKNTLLVQCKTEVKIYNCFCEKCLSRLWNMFPKLKTVQMRDSKTLKFDRNEWGKSTIQQ